MGTTSREAALARLEDDRARDGSKGDTDDADDDDDDKFDGKSESRGGGRQGARKSDGTVHRTAKKRKTGRLPRH